MALLANIIRGGQTWAHRLRMVRQVFRLALLVSICLGGVFFTIKSYRDIDENCVYYWYYLKCRGSASSSITISEKGWKRIFSSQSLEKSRSVRTKRLQKICEEKIKNQIKKSKKDLWTSAWISLWSFVAFTSFFLFRGQRAKKKKYLQGSKCVHPAILCINLKLRRKASDIRIGRLPLVKGTETQHILISGGTGSGKTNCFHHLLPQIRSKRQRAIVVDVTGDFVSKYYREGKDVLLNPFDERSKNWHPWAECKNRFDYDALAQSFIPLSLCEKENYWRTAARAIFSSALQVKRKSQKVSLVKNLILRESLSDLYEELKMTNASSHLDSSADRTAASIRSVAATFLECLEFLEDTEDPFSIRDWVQSESISDEWVFLACTPGQRAALTPLLSAWYSVAMRSLFQMKIDLDRRLWFVTDELPTLQRVKELEPCLTEGRKFGACALLAIQSPAQLEAIYGHNITKVILGNCATKVAFSEHDPEIALKISKVFGEVEVQEIHEGISYGAHEMRDGVSLSSNNKMRAIVTASDLQGLKRNCAFIKLPENLPTAKVDLKYKRMKEIALPFVLKNTNE